ncbi:hypothetical protein [Desulfovibrio inopinatus]|uniref:hypothetical protein n=1 Tax=Desulfovibrio inopinatus TaxID=102109 RepID=UPI00040A0F0F|nr:hypothetical protein [Desulfovibrio inopinatus]
MEKEHSSLSSLNAILIILTIIVVIVLGFYVVRQTEWYQVLKMCDPFSTTQIDATLVGGDPLKTPMPVFVGNVQVGKAMGYTEAGQNPEIWLCIDTEAAQRFNVSTVCYQDINPSNTIQCTTLDTAVQTGTPNAVVLFTSYEDFFLWRTKTLFAAGIEAALQSLREALR